jgi:peroxiredoxin Q/BCP
MANGKLESGTKAPDFCLQDQWDKSVCLKDLKGRWVVLYFYPKDDTPGCTTEACDFTNSLKSFEKLDAVVLGVSPDSPESHVRFSDKYKLKLRLLSDPEHQVIETYGAWGIKKNYGKEYWGVIRSTYLIDPQGRIRHIWPRVTVEGHVEEVHQTLAGLKGNGRGTSQGRRSGK